MKKIWMMSLMVFAVGLIEFAWVPQADAEDQPQSYLMMCRGGGNMAASGYRNITRDRSDTHDINYFHEISIGFWKSPVAAESGQPGPGQCAWMRRPLNQQEPTTLFYQIKNRSLPMERFVVTYRDEPNSIGNKPGVTMSPGDGTTLLDAVREGRLFYVHVYNTNKGYMQITRVGQ